jgi:hypothetical protein
MVGSIIQGECGAASGTSSSSLSQTGYRRVGYEPPRQFTNIDDVAQDHAHTRAFSTIVLPVFSGTTHTVPHLRHTVFLRRDLRQWADYFAHYCLDSGGHFNLSIKATVDTMIE